MSSDATDMIIAFSANKQITGSAENKFPPQANQPVVTRMSRCRGGRAVTSSESASTLDDGFSSAGGDADGGVLTVYEKCTVLSLHIYKIQMHI